MKKDKKEDRDVLYASLVLAVFISILYYFAYQEDYLRTMNTIVAFFLYLYISYRCEKAEKKVQKMRKKYSKALKDIVQQSMEREGQERNG